jgi:glycerol-3-phosphate acyltransferase PlsY
VLLDIGKGTLAVCLAHFWLDQAPLAAFGAFFGHLYPIWLRFAGGKGVATLFGLLLGFSLIGMLGWAAPLAYAVVWLGMLALVRISSVSGLCAAIAAPVAAGLLGRLDLALLFLGFALIVVWKHRSNIARLFAGTEPRVGAGRG